MTSHGIILEFISVNWITVLCSIVTLTLWILASYVNSRPQNFPPGPRGLPFLGVAPYVGRRPELTFMKWSKQYGDIIGFKLGRDNAVAVNSYEMIREAFLRKAGSFSHRPNNFVFRDVLKKRGFTSSDYTPQYKIERKFMLSAINELGFRKMTLEEPIINEVKHFLQLLGEGDVEFDEQLKRKLRFLTGNVIAKLVFGKRFHDDQDADYRLIVDGILKFSENHLIFLVSTIFPFLLKVPPLKSKAMNERAELEKTLNLLKKPIEEHEKNLDESETTDLIDAYLLERKRHIESKSGLFSKDMLSSMTFDLFGAAMDTVSSTIIFSCLLLANRPEIMKKIHREIDIVVGEDGEVHCKIKEAMPYCHSVIMEIMRLRGTAPLSAPHFTSGNTSLGNYAIPKGTVILANLHAVHHDAKYWKDPDEFKPERHLDDQGKITISKFWIPFGIGPRSCIGRRVAEMEIFVLFVSLFQRYDVVPTPTPFCPRPHIPDDALATGITAKPPDNTPVTLVRRK